MTKANAAEPAPKEGTTPIWPLVIREMQERDAIGTLKYRTPLQAFNGRRCLVDAYQESLDLVVYLRQYIEEEQQRSDSLELAFARMRQSGEGLTLSQELQIKEALTWK